jgi:hypothetical protein
MDRPGKSLSLFVMLVILVPLLMSQPVQALGPPDILSAGGGGTSIAYISIKNGSETNNPVNLTVCAKTLLIPYCYSSVGDIGYSIDGGNIYNMTDFINQTITREEGSDDATVWAHVTLPKFTEGSHTITVYFGRQHATRYDVLAYESVNFTISTEVNEITPIPSVPEFPITATLIEVLAVVSLLLMIGKRKQRCNH